MTLIAAEGNEHTDIDHPTIDDVTSPDYPAGTANTRTVDNTCLTMPTEGPHVIAVGAVGPSDDARPTTRTTASSRRTSRRRAATSATSSARRSSGTPGTRSSRPYPKNVAQDDGQLNPDGTPNTPFVVRDCQGTTCAYYQYLQGTSMASPHAVGVAALIVSQFGHATRQARRARR